MLDPRPQFDTYAPRQGEVGALTAEAAGTPGQAAKALVLRAAGKRLLWGRSPERAVRVSAPPTPRAFKEAAGYFAQGTRWQDSGCSLQTQNLHNKRQMKNQLGNHHSGWLYLFVG